MSKHTYRSKKVDEIDWDQLRGKWAGQSLVFAVDVAKETQYALLANQGQPERPKQVFLPVASIQSVAGNAAGAAYSGLLQFSTQKKRTGFAGIV